ncbi:MAG TPA: CheR family methyltransferase, partial [Trebonia sp.]|nr:CheR family methyltransferase [Trebonia sp.]
VRRRMALVSVATVAEYRDYLELQPEEFGALFDSMLINVTGFFRDPLGWQALANTVLPELLSAKSAKAPVRVWSAGCATGQEAYTLAMVIAEAIGPDQFRERVKIYATDLDEEALQTARAGLYDAHALADVPDRLRDLYFESSVMAGKSAFRRDLRRQVIFGRNDLTRDAPISRVDLLAARNTLMYFNAEAQANVIRRFHFALSYPGYLFLGKAEMLLNHADRFTPVDLRNRLFRKTSPAVLDPRGAAGPADVNGAETPARIEGATLSAGPVAQLAVDLSGKLRVANAAAEALFNLRPRDLGRPFQDLEVSYRPVELRSRIDHVRKELRPAELHDVEWQRPGGAEPAYYDLAIVPLFGGPGDLIGVGVSFTDVTRYRRVRDELAHANTELERAYEELQSLNEELETTNEELQSTNEELETTNEELQSTNEELETMNEELQSTNDELQVINDELRGRSEELDQANSFLSSVLRSLGSAVIVLDDDLRVQVWSPGAADLWGLRPEEAEAKDLLSLDIGLPAAETGPMLRKVLAGASADGTGATSAHYVTAVNRRGKTVELQIAASPMRTEEGKVSGVILVIDHHPLWLLRQGGENRRLARWPVLSSRRQLPRSFGRVPAAVLQGRPDPAGPSGSPAKRPPRSPSRPKWPPRQS